MELYKITPDKDLAKLLQDGGVREVVYFDFERPTSSLPVSFIEIVENGATQRISSDGSLYKAVLALTINVKLMANGSKNGKKEALILKSIENALANQRKYSISPFVMFKGKSIDANYSYKTINIITHIY